MSTVSKRVCGRQLSGRLENMVGWYHSHPGYGCWLSGIDCQTQMTQQLFQEPFLALVIDPHRTIAAGKVELGAFRTYPEACGRHTLAYDSRPYVFFTPATPCPNLPCQSDWA